MHCGVWTAVAAAAGGAADKSIGAPSGTAATRPLIVPMLTDSSLLTRKFVHDPSPGGQVGTVIRGDAKMVCMDSKDNQPSLSRPIWPPLSPHNMHARPIFNVKIQRALIVEYTMDSVSSSCTTSNLVRLLRNGFACLGASRNRFVTPSRQKPGMMLQDAAQPARTQIPTFFRRKDLPQAQGAKREGPP